MPVKSIRDVNLYYETTGRGQAILFIHGLGASTLDWEDQVSFFSRKFQVVTYDVRGHGQSDKPHGPYTIPMFAEDAAKLINALMIDRAHIVGISMGGMIAFELAVKSPDLVRSIIVVNSRPDPIANTNKDRLTLFCRRLAVCLLGMRKIAYIHSKRLFPGPKHKKLRRLFVDRRAKNSTQAYLDSLEAIYNWSAVDMLSRIKCPTLIIAGDMDYRPISQKAAYAGQISGAELVIIPNSRHATPMERPNLFNQTLMKFLTKLEKQNEE